MRRLFAVYAAVTLVPVLLLSAVLVQLLAREGNARGLAEGRAKADLIARTAVAPLLAGTDLRRGLSSTERSDLARSVDTAVRDKEVLRLRLRNLDGAIVFSDDRSEGSADEDALRAAAGQTVAELSYLNADEDAAADSADPDSDDAAGGSRGPRVVEVYLPLDSAQADVRIGVLEMYLPYAPIAADIAHGQRSVLIAIGAGLALLWLCLSGVTASVMRRLRRQSAANAFLASHDQLTGLPNRTAFLERLTNALSPTSPTGQGRRVTVAVLDLDRFRHVNDALGYANGDQVIQTIAARLSDELGPLDTLARLGADEFGVILTADADPGAHGPDGGADGGADAHGDGDGDGEEVDRLRRLRAVVNEPLTVNEIPLSVEAGIGYVVATGLVEASTLLRQADIALTVSKAEYRGVVRYASSQDTYDSSALILVAQLHDAITEGRLVLHYQPKCDLRSGEVTAVEALVRWQHPTRGLLFPDSFMTPIEQTELIDDLTRWVLRTACESLPALDPRGLLSVAVNISARSLIRPDFADEVMAILAANGTDPARVMLEITETAILADPPRARHTLTRLHDSGVHISIDDFGAGQTSLGYLATMPISELKIDKSFVMSMDTDDRNIAIVRSVIDLGHSLGVSVIAEGVETRAALQTLRELGCDTVQGFLLSRPVPLSEITERIASAADAMLTAGR